MPFAMMVLLLTFVSSTAAQGFDVMHFREIDGNSQYLYSVTCFGGKDARCSIRVITVSNAKSPRKCMISYDQLLMDEPASNPQPKTYSISSSKGACGYTNTYTISPKGMVQVKTAPDKIPEKLKGMCESFPPKTYNIPADKEDGHAFMNVPVNGCSSMSVILN